MAKKRSVHNFIPLNLELLVTVPQEHTRKTGGGIIIPEGVDLGVEGQMNTVVKAGENCQLAQEGDEVVMKSGKLSLLDFREGTFALVRENQLGGVVRPDNPIPADELIANQSSADDEEQNVEIETQ